MEIGSDQVIVKPDRYPDHVTPYGAAFWWPEMVYMSRDNKLYKMVISEDTQQLVSFDAEGNQLGDKYFPRFLKEVYDKWLFETFETHFFGKETDE